MQDIVEKAAEQTRSTGGKRVSPYHLYVGKLIAGNVRHWRPRRLIFSRTLSTRSLTHSRRAVAAQTSAVKLHAPQAKRRTRSRRLLRTTLPPLMPLRATLRRRPLSKRPTTVMHRCVVYLCLYCLAAIVP